MRASIIRVGFLVAFSFLSAVAGGYLAINDVYDRLDAELPELLKTACLP